MGVSSPRSVSLLYCRKYIAVLFYLSDQLILKVDKKFIFIREPFYNNFSVGTDNLNTMKGSLIKIKTSLGRQKVHLFLIKSIA